MSDESDSVGRRRPWVRGPDGTAPPDSWLLLDDDALVARIETLPEGHDRDADLMEVIRSDRHFFVRQEAAKRLVDHERLKEYSDDRHIGQILARRLSRREEVVYLERLIAESRHIDVRNAARVQLDLLYERLQVTAAAQLPRGVRAPTASRDDE